MSIKILSFFVTLIAFIHLSRGEYPAECRIYKTYCKSKLRPHTLCKYKAKIGPNCIKPTRSGLTNDEIKQIVSAHNEYRQRVVNGGLFNNRSQLLPKADPSYMNELEWDNDLAMIAQRWASQCTFDHDECRNIGPEEKDEVGQNIGIVYEDTSNGGIATGNFSDADITGIVYEWFIEYEMVEISEISLYSGKKTGIIPVRGKSDDELQIGHFTQLAWGETSRVGCGAQVYYDEDFESYAWLLICNYHPLGNWIGKPVYKIDPNQNPVYNEVIQV